MKKGTFFTIFIITNILFLILQIQKQSAYVERTYEKQRLEQHTQELEQQKRSFIQELHALKDPTAIKQYAQTQGMRPIRLDQVKTIAISDEEL